MAAMQDLDRQPLMALSVEDGCGVSIEASKAPAEERRRRRLLAGAGVITGLLVVAVVVRTLRESRNPFAAPGSDIMGAYASVRDTEASDRQFNETVARAMALLAKATYCDGSPGVYSSVSYSCGQTGLPGVRTECEAAGFVTVPGFVRVVQAPGAFSIVARLKLLDPLLAKVKGFVLAFRGSLDSEEDRRRDADAALTPLTGDVARMCPGGAAVHKGLYETWAKLKDGVIKVLRETTGGVTACTGHGTGALLCAIAMMDLKMNGFQVVSSYTFSMPPPGNDVFKACFERYFSGLTPLFRITHGRDLSCLPLGQVDGYAYVGAEVHYPQMDSGAYKVCQDDDPTCGCANARAEKAVLSHNDSCTSVLAPEGSFCNFGSYQATCWMGTGFHWHVFGPAVNDQPKPWACGVSDLRPRAPGLAERAKASVFSAASAVQAAFFAPSPVAADSTSTPSAAPTASATTVASVTVASATVTTDSTTTTAPIPTTTTTFDLSEWTTAGTRRPTTTKKKASRATTASIDASSSTAATSSTDTTSTTSTTTLAPADWVAAEFFDVVSTTALSE